MGDTMTEILAARRVVRRRQVELERATEARALARERLKEAQARLDELLDDEAAGVQRLPFGEEDGQPREGKQLIQEVYEALISVGHTPSQARAAIDRHPNDGRYPTVSQWIEAIYSGGPVPAEAATDVDAEPPFIGHSTPGGAWGDADHEEEPPDWHGEPVKLPEEVERELWDAAMEFGRGMAEPWPQGEDAANERDDRILEDAKAEADALAKIEAVAARAKGRKRKAK